ncbi:42606_t:CDS:2 [Gigaspora margarita]|uniref:42606_t:CDS:1 n=1 Tax=Gigaspora margarita TaxID=4874 RepID=A0ABN7VUK4_GIGMA|nr:42606_t:CDS:2 [Gigaspora margarita]
MDTNKKEIIISLVKSELSGGLDIISSKGGGYIFSFHGPRRLSQFHIFSINAQFLQRISIILKFDNLDELACAQDWHTFLDCEDGKDESQVDIDKLKQ